MGNNWLFTSSSGKDLVCIVDGKLSMSQQLCATAQKTGVVLAEI